MREYCGSVLLSGGGGDYVKCRTYEAFAAALRGCLLDILTPVRLVEELIVQNSKSVIVSQSLRFKNSSQWTFHTLQSYGCLVKMYQNLIPGHFAVPFPEKTVTLLLLLEESKVTFDLAERLYELFQEGVLCVHQQVSHPTAKQVRAGNVVTSREVTCVLFCSVLLGCWTACGWGLSGAIAWVDLGRSCCRCSTLCGSRPYAHILSCWTAG